MKKAISSFVATVLLIGFTVAVGAILSVWFTTFTRTQTAAVQAGAACSAGVIKIFSNVSNTPTSAIRVFLTNTRNDMNITVNDITVACGSSYSTQTNPKTPIFIMAASTNYTDVTGISDCTSSNTEIRVSGSCSTGGSFSAYCPIGGCGFY